MINHNNKWLHGTTSLELPPIPKGFMEDAGIYYLTVTLDKNVGEEVILMIYDPTDFIYELRNLEPFQFYMSSIAVNTSFGPVFSFLFWVSQPHDKQQSFSIYDKPIDISKPVEAWVKLANQTHLHLLLIGENYEVQGFFEFENLYPFHKALEIISLLDASKITDFDRAQQQYFDRFSLKYLFELATNRHQ